MTLQRSVGALVAEEVDDLCQWLRSLAGCPPVSDVVVVRCGNPAHGDEALTWFYVEGDPTAAVARRRCLACGEVVHLLDSAEHWTYPAMKNCVTCSQSMYELAVGLSIEPDTTDRVGWLVVGVRCVGCGRLDGLTDMVVPGWTVAEVTASL